MNVKILTCVYNDWPAATALLSMLEEELQRANLTAEVIIVDDGSSEPGPEPLTSKPFSSIRLIQVVTLKKNLGTQRAIAVGLCYIYEHLPFDALVVMDADGEDKPSDVVRLIRAMAEQPAPTIVFAERSKRSETFMFRLFYQLYRLVHVVLTGRKIRFGNFSAVPHSLLQGLVIDMNLWNHYAACVRVSKLRTSSIPTERGKRICGKSKLNFTALVIHGLSAIACYNESISVRLLICTSISFTFLLAAFAIMGLIALFGGFVIPPTLTYMAAISGIALLQLLLFSLVISMTFLGSRTSQAVIPFRDYSYFVDAVRELYRTQSRTMRA